MEKMFVAITAANNKNFGSLDPLDLCQIKFSVVNFNLYSKSLIELLKQ